MRLVDEAIARCVESSGFESCYSCGLLDSAECADYLKLNMLYLKTNEINCEICKDLHGHSGYCENCGRKLNINIDD